MNGWLILALILLAFLGLLLLPLSISVSFADDKPLTVHLKILFLRFGLYPKKRRRLKRLSARGWRRKKRGAIKKNQNAAAKAKAHPKKKRTAKEYLRLFRLLLAILQKTHEGLLSAFRIRICRMWVAIATEDPARTAITYGIAAQLFAYAIEIIEQFVHTKRVKKSIRVYPDFCAQSTRFEIHLLFTSCVAHLLIYAVKAAMAHMQYKAEENKKNEKKAEDTQHG